MCSCTWFFFSFFFLLRLFHFILKLTQHKDLRQLLVTRVFEYAKVCVN